MKKITLAMMLSLAAPGALAQSDYAITFAIPGGLTTQNLTTLELDVDAGDRYLAVNGALLDANRFSTAVTGTCFFTSGGGVACSLQADQNSLTVALDSNLNGTIEIKNSNGSTFDSASISISGVQ